MFQVERFFFKFIKEFFVIVYNNEGNVNYKFFYLIIISSFELLEILKLYNYNLILQFLYHFYKDINKNLNYIILFNINRLFLKRYLIIINNN